MLYGIGCSDSILRWNEYFEYWHLGPHADGVFSPAHATFLMDSGRRQLSELTRLELRSKDYLHMPCPRGLFADHSPNASLAVLR